VGRIKTFPVVLILVVLLPNAYKAFIAETQDPDRLLFTVPVFFVLVPANVIEFILITDGRKIVDWLARVGG